MELQQQQQSQQLGGYGLYRNPYGNPDSPTGGGGFGGGGAGAGGARGGGGSSAAAAAAALGGYPFAPMQNPYPGYHHLGYPGSQSPGRDGRIREIKV